MKLANILMMALSLAAISGCAGQSSMNSVAEAHAKAQMPSLNSALFRPQQSVVSAQQLFALTASQQQDFLLDFNDRLSDLPEHERISVYLQDLTFGFNYKEQTYTASEAFALSAGNCMALAILTKGLADLVDVEIKFQRVTNAPVFDRKNNIVLVSDHVRARLYKPLEPAKEGENKTLLKRAWVVVDYFPSLASQNAEMISETEFLALYYRNRAAELMVDGLVDEAYAYATEALTYTPKDSEVLNILGLLHGRKDDANTAEQLFNYALRLDADNLNVLHNYQALAKRQHRHELVAKLEQRIQSIPEANPYAWIALGDAAFAQNQLDIAMTMYRKAAEQAPYVHEAYWGQAQVFVAQGETHKARRILEKGMREAKMSATKARFKTGWYSYQEQAQKKPLK
ncbi:tetratricopeptide repeat protein [Pseudidiomarina marina]|uniref:Uncharacterized protein n=1 Tax=Pseudidiomarina marina TaxID=502366 RepID=A0A432YGC8_9GAMM|nr:hypothetical protein [Pseudidiomarina marina]RUO60008.1 hypothetical protein CWI76_07750 [Pseudidiomarina marina]